MLMLRHLMMCLVGLFQLLEGFGEFNRVHESIRSTRESSSVDDNPSGLTSACADVVQLLAQQSRDTKVHEATIAAMFDAL